MSHHEEGPYCYLCGEKLKFAHEKLKNWFWDLKKEFQDVHISCSWRGQEEQARAFLEGKTKAQWPYSKHNNLRDGEPCSLALDLFQLQDRKALFKPRYFAEIHRFNQEQGHDLQWGGKFRKLVDAVHFELKNEIS